MSIKKSDNQIVLSSVYGPFTLNRPSLFTQIEIHKEAARSVGGVSNLDAMGELYALWMATVRVCAMSQEQIRAGRTDPPKGWPEGFSWDIAYDPEFLPDLIKRFNEWQASFRKPTDVDAGETGSAAGGEESGVRPANATEPVAD